MLVVYRVQIKSEWIPGVISNPDKTSVQADGRVRNWDGIDEMDGRYLRVVLLEDGQTVHNAFFERRFKL